MCLQGWQSLPALYTMCPRSALLVGYLLRASGAERLLCLLVSRCSNLIRDDAGCQVAYNNVTRTLGRAPHGSGTWLPTGDLRRQQGAHDALSTPCPTKGREIWPAIAHLAKVSPCAISSTRRTVRPHPLSVREHHTVRRSLLTSFLRSAGRSRTPLQPLHLSEQFSYQYTCLLKHCNTQCITALSCEQAAQTTDNRLG